MPTRLSSLLAALVTVGLTHAAAEEPTGRDPIGFVGSAPARALESTPNGFTVEGVLVPVPGLVRPVATPVAEGLWVIREVGGNKAFLFDARLGTAPALRDVYLIPVSGHGELFARMTDRWELFDVDPRARALRRLWSAPAREHPRSIVAGRGELVVGFPRLARDGTTRETWLAFVRPNVPPTELRVGPGEWLVVSPEPNGPRILLTMANHALGPAQVGRPEATRTSQTATVATFDRTTGTLHNVGTVEQCRNAVAMGCCDVAWSLPVMRWANEPARGASHPLGQASGALMGMGACDSYAFDPATGTLSTESTGPGKSQRDTR